MTPGMTANVVDHPRERFNVSYIIGRDLGDRQEGTTIAPDRLRTTFRTISDGFVTVTGGKLAPTVLGPSEFFLMPINDAEDNLFHLVYSGQAFVTPNTSAPFEFYLSSRFPAEPPAVFALVPYQFHLNSSYGGKQLKTGFTCLGNDDS